ncbi:hypothetical protein OESDEN_25575, partial [Oesophagostomum dentatum]
YRVFFLSRAFIDICYTSNSSSHNCIHNFEHFRKIFTDIVNSYSCSCNNSIVKYFWLCCFFNAYFNVNHHHDCIKYIWVVDSSARNNYCNLKYIWCSERHLLHKVAVLVAFLATKMLHQVTFSFKPKTEPEPAPQVTASFTFHPKPSTGTSLGFAAAAAAAASSVDDEGMDDDGATSGSTQGTSSIFGGGFMSGIGSATGSHANKNVFGMGTSNLLKNTSSQPATSSLFKTGQPSIFGSNTQTSSFASAAQQAASSNVSPSSSLSKSVFGSSPKFGGPPVFGGKPVFGSPATHQSSAFGGATPTTGGFSSFSGNKNLFGGASSGGSSLFGGGTSNQNQPKSSL